MPAYIFDRIPFPGPDLPARIPGEMTPDRVKIVRKATAIVEKELTGMKVFESKRYKRESLPDLLFDQFYPAIFGLSHLL